MDAKEENTYCYSTSFIHVHKNSGNYLFMFT